jgi:hypothetical protein
MADSTDVGDCQSVQSYHQHIMYLDAKLLTRENTSVAFIHAAIHALQSGHFDKVLFGVTQEFVHTHGAKLRSLLRNQTILFGSFLQTHRAAEVLVCGCGETVHGMIDATINHIDGLYMDSFLHHRWGVTSRATLISGSSTLLLAGIREEIINSDTTALWTMAQMCE